MARTIENSQVLHRRFLEKLGFLEKIHNSQFKFSNDSQFSKAPPYHHTITLLHPACLAASNMRLARCINSL